MICRKCDDLGTVTVKKDYSYCESCFLHYINHKFRACIGKNKVITPNENVVIGLSGGIGSTVLIDLIHMGISLNTHKKLRIQPHFVHLTEEEESHNLVANTIEEQCKKYDFKVHLKNISIDNILSDNLTNVHKTSSNDVIKRIKQNMLVNVAEDLKCRLIFTSEPATNLAAKLLTNLVIGRGSQIESDVSFSDDRHGKIKILRPLRDITKEELQYYANIKGLVPAHDHHPKPNSLHSVIDCFVNALENDSPATISTICKTADKIGSSGCRESEKKCVLCKGNLDTDNKKLTAIQATTFSKMVSYTNKNDTQLNHIIIPSEGFNDKSMFPFIHKHLCYCCSRNYTEMSETKLQQYVQKQITNIK